MECSAAGESIPLEASDAQPASDAIAVPASGPQGTLAASFEAPVQLREGDIIAGKYRVGRVLGSGAMGTVFAAHHLLLDRRVAIKFLVPAGLDAAGSVARFVREARATATLKSEHVVRVLDVALLEGGAPYIVMEYLEGCDLAGWLRAQSIPDVAQVVDFMLQACDAIAEAHDLGIIHRDLKPANLFAVHRLGAVETIKVLDFGISKAAGLVSSTAPPGEWSPAPIVTEERVPIGSPCYMSPEQMESARDVDHRTDIWALGVTLWELLSRRLPFEGQSLVQVYSRIRSGARPRLRDVAPHVPRGLETVILRCLEPERTRRPASVAELAAALVPFGSSRAAKYAERAGRDRAGESKPSGSRPRLTLVPASQSASLAESTLISPELAAKAERPVPRPATRRAAYAVGLGVLLCFAFSASLWRTPGARDVRGAAPLPTISAKLSFVPPEPVPISPTAIEIATASHEGPPRRPAHSALAKLAQATPAPKPWQEAGSPSLQRDGDAAEAQQSAISKPSSSPETWLPPDVPR